MTISTVEAYQTTDGKLFLKADEAEGHETGCSVAALGAATPAHFAGLLDNASNGDAVSALEGALMQFASFMWGKRDAATAAAAKATPAAAAKATPAADPTAEQVIQTLEEIIGTAVSVAVPGSGPIVSVAEGVVNEVLPEVLAAQPLPDIFAAPKKV